MSEGFISRQPWRGLIGASVSPVRVATDLATITGTGTIDDPLVGVGNGANDLVFNVKTYGAIGNGIADDSVAIRAAMAAATAAGGGTVYFPNGTYIVSSISPEIQAPCLDVPANVSLFGQSAAGAILKMAAGQVTFVRIISIQTANVSVRSLTIDGNKTAQSVDEHRSGFFLLNASFATIDDVIVQNNSGDGIDISIATFTIVQGCQIINNDRDGITWNTSTEYTAVRDCYINGNTGQIHLESDNPDTVNSNVWIENCYCGPAFPGAISFSIGSISSDVHVRNCYVDGVVNLTQASRVTVEDCYIATADVAGPQAVAIGAGCSEVIFSNCVIAQTIQQDADNAGVAISGAAGSGMATSDVTIDNCWISTMGVTTPGIAIADASDVTISNCKIVSPSAANGANGIQCYCNNVPVDNIVIRNNKLENWGSGISAQKLSSPVFGLMVIQGNIIEVVADTPEASAYFLTGPNQIAMSGNDNRNLTTIFLGYPTVPILTGGERGSGGQYNCAGTPNGQISELIGATAFQRDGAAGIVGWINTDGGINGWHSINVT